MKGATSHPSRMRSRASSTRGAGTTTLSLTRECEQASRANDVHSQILWRSIRAKVFARRDAFADAERLAREAVAFGEGERLPARSRADAHADLAEVLELAGRSERGGGRVSEGPSSSTSSRGNLLAARRTPYPARRSELARGGLHVLVERGRRLQAICWFTIGWRTRCPIAPTGPAILTSPPQAIDVPPPASDGSVNEVVMSMSAPTPCPLAPRRELGLPPRVSRSSSSSSARPSRAAPWPWPPVLLVVDAKLSTPGIGLPPSRTAR